VCVLKHYKGEVDGVAFSPDGTHLATGGVDGTILIVDGRPWGPQSQVEQEVRGLVESLFARPLLRADVLEAIRRHKGSREDVRRQALELAERYQDEPSRFSQAGRDVVRHRDAPPALLRKALAWAQTACRLAPDSGACLTTLGIAQYRLGQHAEALATLTRAERLNQPNAGDLPADLAFLAMAHHRLGHQAEAHSALDRLRALMKSPPRSATEEALVFLVEAEALFAP
jgi:tetratricopeptide (TPR) repeat protein